MYTYVLLHIRLLYCLEIVRTGNELPSSPRAFWRVSSSRYNYHDSYNNYDSYNHHNNCTAIVKY